MVFTATSGASTQSSVKAALAQITQYAPANPTITVTSLGKRAPSHRTVDYVTCPLPICVQVGDGVSSAAKALNWKVNVINGGDTPATFTSAWDQISQNLPNAVVGLGLLPTSAIASQLKVLVAHKVPYVSVTTASPVGNGLTGVVNGVPEVQRSAMLLADWVVADAKGSKTDSAYVYDPSEPSIVPAVGSYEKRIKALCPGCGTSTLTVSAEDIGTKIPSEVVSYVQANPNVKYLVFGLGDFAAGVPQALKAAGLSGKVTLLTRVATTTNFADIADGGMAAGFTEEGYELGWRGVNMVLRSLVGVPLGPTQPIGTIHLITKKNLPSNLQAPYVVPGYKKAYEKAWGVK